MWEKWGWVTNRPSAKSLVARAIVAFRVNAMSVDCPRQGILSCTLQASTENAASLLVAWRLVQTEVDLRCLIPKLGWRGFEVVGGCRRSEAWCGWVEKGRNVCEK